MGGGTWTHDAFRNYSKVTGKAVNADGTLNSAYTAQDIFKKKSLAPELNPYKDSIKHSLLITHMNETNYMIFGRWANDYLFYNIYVSDRKDGFII